MAHKPVHGQHHRAHHHAHKAHHHHHAHQGHKAHKAADKPTQADKPAQPAQAPKAAPPQAAVAPQQQPAIPKDKFTPPTATPVNLTPGATGERKAPPSVTTGAPATAAPKTPMPTQAAGAPAAPTPATKPTISEANRLQWINQLAPTGAATDYNGLMNCGPAAGAMIARATGFEFEPKMTDAALVNRLATIGQTDPLIGTTGNGMIAMYEEMGMETTSSRGADMDWINSQLTSGRYVTALGDYYQVPGRVEDGKTAGHYLDVTGYKEPTKHKEARYVVSDPANGELNSLTASQLQSFITAAPQGGFCISCWPTTAVD